MGDLIIFGSLVGTLIWVYRWGRSPSRPSTKIEMEPWNTRGKKRANEEIKIPTQSEWREKIKAEFKAKRDEFMAEYEKAMKEAQKPKSKYDQYRGEYVKKSGLFTPAEAKFMKALESALSDTYLISGKVRVADVIDVTRRDTDRQFYTYFNKVKAKHFDYVLCDKHTYEYVAAIELDDRSHQRPDRIERDEFLNNICKQTGFKLIRFQVKYQYDESHIKRVIEGSIGKKDGC